MLLLLGKRVKVQGIGVHPLDTCMTTRTANKGSKDKSTEGCPRFFYASLDPQLGLEVFGSFPKSKSYVAPLQCGGAGSRYVKKLLDTVREARSNYQASGLGRM